MPSISTFEKPRKKASLPKLLLDPRSVLRNLGLICRHRNGVRRRAPRDRAGGGAVAVAQEGAGAEHDLRRAEPLRLRRLGRPQVRLPRARVVQGELLLFRTRPRLRELLLAITTKRGPSLLASMYGFVRE